jgi:medium-chain acyl-[acyl-carrier-protein] hydrolase
MNTGRKEKMNTNGTSALFSRPLDSNSALRLFCFPYAGGNSSIFHKWQTAMPDGVEVCPIELPGRATRIGEGLITRLPLLIESISRDLVPYLDRPFAFFGHSMGALVSFELVRYLRSIGELAPTHLFVSAWRSPELIDEHKDYVLPDAQFIAMLRKLNGTPEEILDNPEALQLLLPILRADFEVAQTYEYRPQRPLGCAIKAFWGMQDRSTTPEMVRPWSNHTTGPFSLSILLGGHFFIQQSQPQLLKIISHELDRTLSLLASRQPDNTFSSPGQGKGYVKPTAISEA